MCVYIYIYVCVCTRWRSWLRHCATSLEVAGSIPEGVSGILLLMMDAKGIRNM
jgi:hypothetical protein